MLTIIEAPKLTALLEGSGALLEKVIRQLTTRTRNSNWVAVKELILSYHNRDI